MLEARLSHPRKRRNPEQLAHPPAEAHHIAKKQKRSHVSDHQYPPAFWDNLSKVDLTKHALREVDRRNKLAASTSRTPDQQLRKRITTAPLSIFFEEAFQKFVQADIAAPKEKQITTSVIPIIERNIEDAKCISRGIPFTNFDPLTDHVLSSLIDEYVMSSVATLFLQHKTIFP